MVVENENVACLKFIKFGNFGNFWIARERKFVLLAVPCFKGFIKVGAFARASPELLANASLLEMEA